MSVPEAEPGAGGRVEPGPGAGVLARGRRVGGLLRSEPGLALTLGYVTLTLVGMAYLARFYRSFGINIFDYADAGDFLLAGLRDPWVILATLAPFPLAWLYFRGVRLLALRLPGKPRGRSGSASRGAGPVLRVVGVSFMLLTWIAAAIGNYAKYSAVSVRRGKGKAVMVEYMIPPPDSLAIRRPLLLGTTARYVFLFDGERLNTVIVPVSNVARIRVAVPPRRSGR